MEYAFTYDQLGLLVIRLELSFTILLNLPAQLNSFAKRYVTVPGVKKLTPTHEMASAVTTTKPPEPPP